MRGNEKGYEFFGVFAAKELKRKAKELNILKYSMRIFLKQELTKIRQSHSASLGKKKQIHTIKRSQMKDLLIGAIQGYQSDSLSLDYSPLILVWQHLKSFDRLVFDKFFKLV